MYLCSCKGITTRQFEEKLQEFSSEEDITEILKALGVAKDCGLCLKSAIKLYFSKLEEKSEADDLSKERTPFISNG